MQAQPAGDGLEVAVGAAIAACDRDLRATIRTLSISSDTVQHVDVALHRSRPSKISHVVLIALVHANGPQPRRR